MESKLAINQYLGIQEIIDLIYDYKNQGINLWIENGKLKFKAPEKIMTADKIKKIKDYKQQIIEYLSDNKFENDDDVFRLTPIQQAYLSGSDKFFDLGGISANYYFEVQFSSLDIDKLQDAFNEVIKHYDALRTVVFSNGSQKVLDSVSEYKINIVKLKSEDELISLRKKWSKQIYELGKWPMFNVNLTTYNDNDYRLHIGFDCVVLDAWSVKIMLKQMFKIYTDQKAVYPKYTFREYCNEVLINKNEKIANDAEKYWSERINNIPKAPILPYKFNLSEIDIPDFDRINHKLTKKETQKLYHTIQKYRFTPAAVICTAYMKVLSKFSKEKDLTLNLTVFNRIPVNKEVQDLLGDFTNISLATYLYDQNKTFVQEVADTQKEFWNLVKYRRYNGVNIIGKIKKDNPRQATMPVVFTGVLQGLRTSDDYLPENAEEVYAYSQTPQVSLDFQATDLNGELSLNWDYVQNAFDKEQIKHMFDATVKFIRKLAEEDWNKVIKIND